MNVKEKILNNWGLIEVAALCVGLLYVLLMGLLDSNSASNICQYKADTGIPCPGCGMCHAAESLLYLNLVEAWQYNPAIYIFIACAVAHVFSGKYFKYVRWVDYFLVMSAVFIQWIVRLFTGFPSILFMYP